MFAPAVHCVGRFGVGDLKLPGLVVPSLLCPSSVLYFPVP